MAIAAGSIAHDVTIFIRNLISGNVGDPQSGARTGNTSQFVMTNYPERNVVYPLITVLGRRGSAEKLGSNSQSMKVPVTVETRVWSKKKGECDQLGDAVFKTLAQNQSGGNGTEQNGMFAFSQANEVDVDETGRDGIHSRVSEYRYFVLI